MKKLGLSLFLVISMGLLIGQASASVIIYDVSLQGSVFKHRFASAGDGQQAAVQTGDANDRTYKGIVEWDLSSFPEASEISSVFLTFDYEAYGTVNTAINLEHISVDGSAITYASGLYNSAPIDNFGTIVASGGPTGRQPVSFDVTDAVKADLINGLSYSGFRYSMPGADGLGTEGKFYYDSKLNVTTIPEPTTLSMLGLAFILTRLYQKRR